MAEEEEFSQGEFEAAAVLLEFEQKMLNMCWVLPWGLKKKRTRIISALPIVNFNYNHEVKEQEQGAHASVRKRIRAASGEDKGRKRSPTTPLSWRGEDKGRKKSPTTPLSWSGTERGSQSSSGGGAGDRSDSASQAELRLILTAPPVPPFDHSLGQPPAFKDQIGNKVHNPSGRKGPKRKTNAELKEQVEELSLEKEEMKKEKNWRLQLLQSLRNENELWKAKLALLGEKEEAKLPVIRPETSSDLGQETKGPALSKPFPGNVELECYEKLDVNSPFLGHVELECYEKLDVNSPLVQEMEGTSSVADILPPHHINMNGYKTQDILMTTHSGRDRLILPDLNIALSLEDSGGCD